MLDALMQFFLLNSIEESFAFLSVGHWLQGGMGEDRKNISGLIHCFFDTYKNQKDAPALILKTSGATYSVLDRCEIESKILQIRDMFGNAKLPNVYFLHGDLTDEEMNLLYNHPKIKAMISFTKAEGFGRPLLEFSLTKKPILASNWSGHKDFLSEEFTTLIPGELHNLDDSSVVQDMLMKEFQWFGVDNGAAFISLRDVFANYKDYKEKANRQTFRSKTNFSFEKMQELISTILEKNVPDFPKQVELVLPKIEFSKLKKIE